MRLLAILFALLLTGGAQSAENPGARKIFETVERNLLAAEDIEFYVHVDIQEPYVRRMDGRVKLPPDGSVEGRFRGAIGSQRAVLDFAGNGKTLELKLNDEKREGKQPAALREALLITLMRAGFGQPLINLSQLNPPERSDGGVRDWISVANVMPRDAAVGQGYHSGEISIQFDLMIAGKKAGHARLWISTTSKLPTRREQFLLYTDASGKQSEMRIDERYTYFYAGPKDVPEVQVNE